MLERGSQYSSGLHHPIDIDTRTVDVENVSISKQRSCKDYCRILGVCIRVSPWVPLIGAIMIATGLPVWSIYTRRALDATARFSDTLFGVRTFAIDQMASNVHWVTFIGVIVISVIVGFCALLSLLRTYQETSRRPKTKCSPVGKVSYGAYASLISMVSFGLWLMSIVVALLIAAQLCWLMLAFIFETAFKTGVEASASPVAPQAFLTAAREAMAGIKDNIAAVPKGSLLAQSVEPYAAAAKQAKADVCPTSCMNLGSFYKVFEAPNPCLCTRADQYPELLATTTDIWKHLVHALAALALMGLADLWLIMNLSAQFAHARRDIRDLNIRYALDTGRLSDDSTAAVYVTTNPTFNSTPDKRRMTSRKDVAATGDSPRKSRKANPAALRGSGSGGGGPAAEGDFRIPAAAGAQGPFGALPDAVISPPAPEYDESDDSAEAVAEPFQAPMAARQEWREASAPKLGGSTAGGAAAPVDVVTQALSSVGGGPPAATLSGSSAAVAGAYSGRGGGRSSSRASAAAEELPAAAVVTVAAAPAAPAAPVALAAPAPAPVPAPAPARAAAAPAAAPESPGASCGSPSRQHNTTAQRYAAYRLRAAQAQAANKPQDRAKWAR